MTDRPGPDPDIDEENRIICNECGYPVVFREYPYDVNKSYVLKCDCILKEIDITECVDGNNLLQPLSGAWSQFEGRDTDKNSTT